jgi:hypothetical protein
MKKTLFRIYAVTAALAALALFVLVLAPKFMVSRQRSRATKVVNDARIYEAAVDLWQKEQAARDGAGGEEAAGNSAAAEAGSELPPVPVPTLTPAPLPGAANEAPLTFQGSKSGIMAEPLMGGSKSFVPIFSTRPPDPGDAGSDEAPAPREATAGAGEAATGIGTGTTEAAAETGKVSTEAGGTAASAPTPTPAPAPVRVPAPAPASVPESGETPSSPRE